MLWFAFILVSLNHWKQYYFSYHYSTNVVICFHFSIFEPLETVKNTSVLSKRLLWFAFILVSLNHWKQCKIKNDMSILVVICFHFSIFEPLETVHQSDNHHLIQLWFAFILVSLNHWKQLAFVSNLLPHGCDLLSF